MPYIAALFISAATFVGLYNYLPLDLVTFNEGRPTFGATITTIAGSDTLSASRSVINTNFANLNADKFELSAWYATTSKPNLATVGTITGGTWNGTAIGVGYGGTGTTSPTADQVMLGNGASGLKVVAGFGTSGQVLTSNGAASAPSWQSISFDTAANYTVTGEWTFNGGGTATTTFNRGVDIDADSDTPVILNGLSYIFPSSGQGNGKTLTTNGSGTLAWASTTPLIHSTTTDAAYTGVSSATVWTQTIPGNTLGTNGVVRGRLFIRWQSISTTAKQMTLTVGGTTCVNPSATPDANTSRSYEGFVEFEIIAAGSTSAQDCYLTVRAMEDQVDIDGTPQGVLWIAAQGTLTKDSTADLAVSLSVNQHTADTFTVYQGVMYVLK